MLNLQKNLMLCISVKLKNLKANHNAFDELHHRVLVVYIRKVKKSESKSQPSTARGRIAYCCVYP